MRSLRRFFTVLQRRWQVIMPVIGLTALAAAGIGSLERVSYSSSMTFYVPAGQDAEGPGEAYNASLLAGSYAVVIPTEQDFRTNVSNVTGVDADDVPDHVVATQIGTTASLDISYTSAASSAEAFAAMQEIRNTVERGTPAVPAGSLVALEATPTTEESGRLLAGAPWIGGVLGIFLAAGLVALWERADPRIDDADDLQLATGLPVTDLDRAGPRSLRAVLARWQELASSSQHRIAVVDAEPGRAQLSRQAVARLDAIELHPLEKGSEQLGPTGSDGTAAPTLVPSPPSGGVEAGTAAAFDVGAAIIVVRRGGRQRDVVAAVNALRQLDVPPLWAVVMSSGRN